MLLNFPGITLSRISGSTIFNKGIFCNCDVLLGFNGGFIKKPYRKKKSKLRRTLEEGDLFFNLMISIWLFLLWFIFAPAFKNLFLYKLYLFLYYSITAIFILNFTSKILAIAEQYFKESIDKKTLREIEEKKSKRKP